MLLGLTGAAQAGKDTIYGMIRAMSFDGTVPCIVRRDAFADRLKLSAARALGYRDSDEECIDAMNRFKNDGWVDTSSDGEHIQITGREYLQYYGTEAHRQVFGTDFWIKAVLPDGYPSQIEQEQTLLVVTDVRFENEAIRVHECGGRVWRIQRPKVGIEESSHASEQPLGEQHIDATIVNEGSLDDLEDKVRLAVSFLLDEVVCPR